MTPGKKLLVLLNFWPLLLYMSCLTIMADNNSLFWSAIHKLNLKRIFIKMLSLKNFFICKQMSKVLSVASTSGSLTRNLPLFIYKYWIKRLSRSSL